MTTEEEKKGACNSKMTTKPAEIWWGVRIFMSPRADRFKCGVDLYSQNATPDPGSTSHPYTVLNEPFECAAGSPCCELPGKLAVSDGDSATGGAESNLKQGIYPK